MEGASASASNSRDRVQEVFNDFQARRTALINALTVDADELFLQCDPGEDNLCLFGNPDAKWVVRLPDKVVPPELPEPVLGVNFPRDIWETEVWLSWVANHSDAWLISVASFESAKRGFNKADRQLLHDLTEELPTLTEVVLAEINKQQQKGKKKASTSSSRQGPKPRSQRGGSNTQTRSSSRAAAMKAKAEAEADVEEKACAACRVKDLWIPCCRCERWFHGRCISISPATPDAIKKHFACVFCKDRAP